MHEYPPIEQGLRFESNLTAVCYHQDKSDTVSALGIFDHASHCCSLQASWLSRTIDYLCPLAVCIVSFSTMKLVPKKEASM